MHSDTGAYMSASVCAYPGSCSNWLSNQRVQRMLNRWKVGCGCVCLQVLTFSAPSIVPKRVWYGGGPCFFLQHTSRGAHVFISSKSKSSLSCLKSVNGRLTLVPDHSSFSHDSNLHVVEWRKRLRIWIPEVFSKDFVSFIIRWCTLVSFSMGLMV